jgi:hypothetical protein
MGIAVLPLNITFKEWASQIRIDIPSINVPIPPDDVEYWKSWASQVVNNNGLINVPLPTETAYPKIEDWRDWGAYFINSISIG